MTLATNTDYAAPRERDLKKLIFLLVIAALSCGAFVPLLFSSLSFWFYLFQWVVLASAINIMAGFTGYVPFGYVAFFGLGAYAGGVAMVTLGLPFPVAIALAGLSSTALGALLAPTLRLSGVYFALTSFSLAMVVQIVISLLPDSIAGGSQGLTILSVPSASILYLCMLTLAIVTVAISFAIANSHFGLRLKAIRDDHVGASAVGINVPLTRLCAWLISTAVAGIAGCIEASYTSIIDTTTAFDPMISAKSLIFAAFGGLGTVLGPILGTLGISLLDQFIWRETPTLGTFILGATLIFVVVVLPRGLLGTLLHKKPTLRRHLF